MARLNFTRIALFHAAALTTAVAGDLPGARPAATAQPAVPNVVECRVDAVNSGKPWLTSAKCSARRSQPAGAACRWGNECLEELCVSDGAGGGACAGKSESTAACAQSMGPGNATATWTGGLVSLACAGKAGSELLKLCTALPKSTAKPACANGSLSGHSCSVGQPCTTDEMCRDDLSCLKAYPNATGKCVARVNGACPAAHELGTISATDPASLCVPKDLFCH